MIKESKVTIGGVQHNLVVYTPDVIPEGTKLAAVAFIPGIGEQNTNVAGLYVWGPLNFIKAGWKPDFIVAGFQPANQWPPTSWTLAMLKDLIANYPVDVNRICLTGLSAGAKATFDYVNATSNADYIKPASIIGMSIELYAAPEAQWKDLPAWGFCGDADTRFYSIILGTWKTMQAKGWPNKPFTTMAGLGHTGWNNYYNPKYIDPVVKKNLYDWMLQFSTVNNTNNNTDNKIPLPMANEIGRIEAENYTAMSGVLTEKTKDTDGNLNVGWIEKGDWLSYDVNVPAAGDYDVALRVATSVNKPQLMITLPHYSTVVDLPVTGGYQKWETATVRIPLEKGVQTIKIEALTNGWNLNWLDIVPVNIPAPEPIPVPEPETPLEKTLVATIKIYSDGSIEKV